VKGSVEVGTITSSVPMGSNGHGTYTWPIYSYGSNGNDYKVSVQSISQPTIKDLSNNYFTLTPAGTPSASLKVTSPNGGEIWKRGTSQKITWDYSGSPGSAVKITLLKAGSEVGTIIASTSTGSGGKGSYTWPISATGGTGSDYKVKIQSINQPAISDTSNNNFNLTPATTTPSITLTSPNGGEIWKRGTSHTVTWSYTGSPGSTVKIMLVKGSTEVGTIISSVSIGSGGTGTYTWPIYSSGLTGSDYKVKVLSVSQPTIFDMSNNYFKLTL
jgi:5-hydroxyisourate hydrolase-like protein (transthyretin family)